MADLTLYHAVPSRSMTVHWMLEELGEPYDLEMLDLEAREQKAPEYLAINPMGRVPTLRHRDLIVTETAAICAYLADAFPKAHLDVPVDSPLRGEYYRWLFFSPVTMEPAFLWKGLGDLTASIEYRPFAEVEEIASTLCGALAGRKFIVGDHFTAADVMIGSGIMWGMRMLQVLPEHPELVAYWEGLAGRPAWQRASSADQAYMQEKSGTS